MEDCLLCRVADADAEFERMRVWEDELWRLSVVGRGPIAGFAHLEPLRHIPFITDLEGQEAATLGGVLAQVTSGMKAATGAEKIYVYVFGDRVAHLHFNLVPHFPGDMLIGGSGLVRSDPAALPRTAHRAAAHAVAEALRLATWRGAPHGGAGDR